MERGEECEPKSDQGTLRGRRKESGVDGRDRTNGGRERNRLADIGLEGLEVKRSSPVNFLCDLLRSDAAGDAIICQWSKILGCQCGL
jgi:hypothetical protein